jgi:hypothetical protein
MVGFPRSLTNYLINQVPTWRTLTGIFCGVTRVWGKLVPMVLVQNIYEHQNDDDRSDKAF